LSIDIDERIKFFDEKVESLKGRLGKVSYHSDHSCEYLRGELDELEECVMLRERLKFQRDGKDD